MYDYIKGQLVQKIHNTPKGSFLVLEANSIGYLVSVNERVLEALPEGDSPVKVYTSLIHKEDSMQLCGFSLREDRDIFNILQSVSGVGMKVALVLLNEFSGYELISAVIKEDAKGLSKAKGVGPKLAQKIVLELKDKLINWQKVLPVDISDVPDADVSGNTMQEVQSVLLSLGYSIEEIKTAIKSVIQLVNDQDSSEEILKEALQYLAQGG